MKSPTRSYLAFLLTSFSLAFTLLSGCGLKSVSENLNTKMSDSFADQHGDSSNGDNNLDKTGKAGAGEDTLAYLGVQKSNTLAACQEYLSRFPEGAHKDDVSSTLEELSYNLAMQAGTLAAYHEFARRFPDSDHTLEIRQKTELLTEKIARQADSISLFKEYLDLFENGAKRQDGLKIVENLAFQQAKAADSISLYQDFVDHFPKSQHIEEIQNLIAGRHFQIALASHSILLLEDFVATYPESELFMEANEALEQLMFEKTIGLGSQIALNDFRQHYPDSRYRLLLEYYMNHEADTHRRPNKHPPNGDFDIYQDQDCRNSEKGKDQNFISPYQAAALKAGTDVYAFFNKNSWRLHLKQKKKERVDGIAQLEDYTKKEPENPVYYYRLGEALRKRNNAAARDLRQAIIAYKEALNFNHLCDQTHHGLAEAYYLSDEWDAALNEISPLIERFPDESAYLMLRGKIYLKMKEYQKAEKDLLKVIKTNPEDAEVNFFMGKIHCFLRQPLKAIIHLTKCIRIQPDNLEARFYRAMQYDIQSQNRRSKEDLEFIMGNNPDSPWAARARAYLGENGR